MDRECALTIVKIMDMDKDSCFGFEILTRDGPEKGWETYESMEGGFNSASTVKKYLKESIEQILESFGNQNYESGYYSFTDFLDKYDVSEDMGDKKKMMSLFLEENMERAGIFSLALKNIQH